MIKDMLQSEKILIDSQCMAFLRKRGLNSNLKCGNELHQNIRLNSIIYQNYLLPSVVAIFGIHLEKTATTVCQCNYQLTLSAAYIWFQKILV